MSDELKAAAIEILERWEASSGSPVGILATNALKLADAYLCEHPADDDEPVTEEWLLSVGFVKGGSPQARNIYCGYLTIDDIASGEASICNWNDRVAIERSIETRRDVRLLCKALGVTLKEAR